MSDVNERFSLALHATAREWRRAIDRRLKYLGVSQASWMTIATTARSPEPLSQSELADRLAVEGATIVAMIDRLVKAGLVLREGSHTDRRVKYIVLTDAGRKLHDAVQAEAKAVREALLAGIAHEDLLKATQLLEKLQHAIGTIV